MATIIYVPHLPHVEAGAEILLQVLQNDGHEVRIAHLDGIMVESYQNPWVAAVLREHALTQKEENEIFVVGQGDGADAAREAVAYLWKYRDTAVSGLVVLEPRVPLIVAPVRSTFSLARKLLENIASGGYSTGDYLRFLVDMPVFLKGCGYPTLHFYSKSDEGAQRKLGHKLLSMSFSSSHPVQGSGPMILDSGERDVVIERIVSWIDAVMLANLPEEEKVGMTSEAS
jgi:hypothetical protein